MSKKILVFDADTCATCPAGRNLVSCNLDEIWACEIESILHDEIRCVDEYDISTPDWCPLKEIPRGKTLIGIDGASSALEIRERGRQEGWNACVDEIMKMEVD